MNEEIDKENYRKKYSLDMIFFFIFTIYFLFDRYLSSSYVVD